MRRAFDVLACPRCGGRLRLIAAVGALYRWEGENRPLGGCRSGGRAEVLRRRVPQLGLYRVYAPPLLPPVQSRPDSRAARGRASARRAGRCAAPSRPLRPGARASERRADSPTTIPPRSRDPWPGRRAAPSATGSRLPGSRSASEAAAAYHQELALTANAVERRYLRRRIEELLRTRTECRQSPRE
jgi:hypothetical protein